MPSTKKDPVTEELHGHNVSDPYRWLEDGSSAETKHWIEEQNSYTDSHLRGEHFETFSNDLVKNFSVVEFSTPAMRRGRYFFFERQPGMDHGAIYFKQGLDGPAVKLVDPNGMNASNTVTIQVWNPSHSGRYVTYGLTEGGTEMGTLYVMDVDTQKNIPDKISPCRHSSIRWLSDDSGFFYTRNPRQGTVPKNEENLHTKVYLHILGQDSEADELIFGEGRPKDDMIGLALSVDGRYLSIWVSPKWSSNDLFIYDRQTRVTTPLVVGIPSLFALGFLKDRAFIRTNYQANNGRVLWIPLEKLLTPIDAWNVLIPEREHPLVEIMPTRNQILAEYSVDVCSRVLRFDYDGKEIGEIPLPQYSTLVGIKASREEEEFFYGVESFTFPMVAYRFDPINNDFEVFRKTENPINPDDYVVKQERCQSKDGTEIPMFVFHRKDISQGVHPLILLGYGGFGLSETPSFLRYRTPWLERGGVFVVANIRGGAEFGRMWHDEGSKEHKQNSFDDFIAAAEYLIEKKYTDSEHLGIRGGSNGGLLVAAVEMQRPELFKAVCSEVPLTDMVRFPMFGVASRWVNEYGNPNNKEDFERIVSWSPYHNVRDGIEYPETLFTTAENDSRVNPLHARKMAALLQAVNKKNKVYCFTETDAGHGPGRPVKKIVEARALMLAFFALALGLRMK